MSKTYKNGLEYIVNYIYKTMVIKKSNKYIEFDKIQDIDIDDIHTVINAGFSPYTLTNILNYYIDTKGEDFVKRILAIYRLSDDTLRFFCETRLNNINLLPVPVFKDELIKDLTWQLKIDRDKVGSISELKKYYSDSEYRKEFSNYEEDIDVMSINYDNNMDNINRILNYLRKDVRSSEGYNHSIFSASYYDVEILPNKSFSSLSYTNYDEYTMAQIANLYIINKKTKALFKKIQKKVLTDMTVKYLLAMNKNAIIATDLISHAEKIEWVISHYRAYSYRELPDEIAENQRVKELYSKAPIEDEELSAKERERRVNEIISNPSNYVYDELPKELANDERVKEAFQRSKQIYVRGHGVDYEGYNKEDWKDINGNIKQFFSIKNGNTRIQIQSKEEYMKILDSFIKSNLSIEKFCEKYSIVTVDGFRSFLNRVKEEDIDLGKAIKEGNDDRRRKSYAMLQEVVEKLDSGELTVEELLKNSFASSITVDSIYGYALKESKYNHTALKEKVAKQLGDYILDNEYSLEIKNLGKFMGTISKEEGTGFYSGLAKKAEDFLKYNYPLEDNRKKYVIAHQARDIIKSYATPYNRDKLYSGVIVDGKKVDITQDTVDQMLTYLDNNHITRTLKTANHFLKLIALGEIDYREETEKAKQTKTEEIEDIIDDADKISTAEEYMEYVDCKTKKKNIE